MKIATAMFLIQFLNVIFLVSSAPQIVDADKSAMNVLKRLYEKEKPLAANCRNVACARDINGNFFIDCNHLGRYQAMCFICRVVLKSCQSSTFNFN